MDENIGAVLPYSHSLATRPQIEMKFKSERPGFHAATENKPNHTYLGLDRRSMHTHWSDLSISLGRLTKSGCEFQSIIGYSRLGRRGHWYIDLLEC